MADYITAKRQIEAMNMEFDNYLSRDREGEPGISRPNIERFIDNMRNEYRRLAESTIKQDRMVGDSVLDSLRSYELIWKRQEEMHLEESARAREKSRFMESAIEKVVKACAKHGLPVPEDIDATLGDQYDQVVRTGGKPIIAYNKTKGFIIKNK